VLFQGGKFSAHDVAQTALALVGYAVGLFGLIAVKILAPGFYAQQDVKTPVKVAVISLVATQASNLVLVPLFAHAGLALSVGIGALVNASLLFTGLYRRNVYRPQPGWLGFAGRLAVALAALALLLWFADRRIDWVGMQAEWVNRALWLGGVIAAAIVVYLGLLLLLGFRMRDFSQRAQ
jgi:putative peptidoglycan lipid II flippase